ncbi:hypothetical protein A3Q56_04438 [Intoshia linei]|uniref:Tetraspanin n=1 Tax=Intoshia linei TaxID=1819745 RepID=A0A177B0P3_9BILA|nr:hypothetical protein A3Q56_04438 [Intoshia linei]
MGCSTFACVKSVFFLFNAIFWLFGCVTLGLGVWVQYICNSLDFNDTNYILFTATVCLIAAGSLIVLFGFLGCCGVVINNKCIMIAYFIVIVLVIGIQISSGVMIYVYRDRLETSVSEHLVTSIKSVYDNSEQISIREDLWDSYQEIAQCCGVNDHSEWFNSNSWSSERWVPDSCCVNYEVGCGKKGNFENIYKMGCAQATRQVLKDNIYIVLIIAIVILLSEILSMMSVLALACYKTRGKTLIIER